MTREEALDQIANLPGGDGWWHDSGYAVFQALGTEMMDVHKVSPESTVRILGIAFGATASEFGS